MRIMPECMLYSPMRKLAGFLKMFNIQDIVWYKLDSKSVVEIGPVTNPDLSNVEEIGFTDLMPGGKSASCSRLDWIEVYGKTVKRK